MKRPITLKLNGHEYVVVPRREYDRMVGLARVASMPPLPQADASRRYPAVEYARASMAREIVGRRIDAGLSQRELARAAGVRVETLCRIERAKNSPSPATIEKLDRALLRVEHRRDRTPGHV